MNKIDKIKNNYIGLSYIIAPLLLLFGLLTHPNLLSFEVMTTGEQFALEYRNNYWMELGHIAVLFSSLFFMGIFRGFNLQISKSKPNLGFLIFCMGFFGSFMLGVDKGAFALVPSAFETLSDHEYSLLTPAFTAMVNYKGAMWIAMLYVFIPLTLLISGVTLYRNRLVKRWQSISIILGALLYFNPDIDIISFAATFIISVGLFPIGISYLKKTETFKCNC